MKETILIIVSIFGILFFLKGLSIHQRSKNLKKQIKFGETGMKVRYWIGETKFHGTVKGYDGNFMVRLEEEILPVHIDNIEPLF